jgi:hypothetical protein
MQRARARRRTSQWSSRGDADDDAALAWGLVVAVLQRRDSAIAQVD